jgi:hypothetical protein
VTLSLADNCASTVRCTGEGGGVAVSDATGDPIAAVFQSVENVEATASLVQRLTELGHRRILFVGGLKGLSTSEELVEGYRLGLAPSGLSYDRSLVCHGRPAAEPAERAVGALLIKRDLPDAIVPASNYMTIGVLLALQRYGLCVQTTCRSWRTTTSTLTMTRRASLSSSMPKFARRSAADQAAGGVREAPVGAVRATAPRSLKELAPRLPTVPRL